MGTPNPAAGAIAIALWGTSTSDCDELAVKALDALAAARFAVIPTAGLRQVVLDALMGEPRDPNEPSEVRDILLDWLGQDADRVASALLAAASLPTTNKES